MVARKCCLEWDDRHCGVNVNIPSTLAYGFLGGWSTKSNKDVCGVK